MGTYRHIFLLHLNLLAMTVCSFAQPALYEHPIPFNPESYVCYKTNDPLEIDGKGDEPDWQAAPWTADFVDIEGALKPAPRFRTRAKMLWDQDFFYVYAHMEEPHVWATLKNRDDIIYHDDDFEVFIDPDGDTHNYFELEVNALNTLWDLFLVKPYRVDRGEPKALFNWNIADIRTAVYIDGSLNDPSDTDRYWSVEMAIPWQALMEFAPGRNRPAPGDQWRVNFSRVDWHMHVEEGKYVKEKLSSGKPVPENNWVWSPTGRVNMHMPEMWGYVQFSDQPAGQGEEHFVKDPDQSVRWALWNLFHQQRAFYRTHERYSDEPGDFILPDVTGCSLQPVFHATPRQFEITVLSCDGKRAFVIDQDGKLKQL